MEKVFTVFTFLQFKFNLLDGESFKAGFTRVCTEGDHLRKIYKKNRHKPVDVQ